MNPDATTEALWTQLSAALRQFIRRRVEDDHTADDLLQETFLRIHRTLNSIRETDRLAAWVHQIARNAIVDHYRKNKKRQLRLRTTILSTSALMQTRGNAAMLDG